MAYEYKESYKHKLAKDLLFDWLVNNEKEESLYEVLPGHWRRDSHAILKEFAFYDDNNGQFLFIPDITIYHKQNPAVLIEVVHTSPLSEAKIKRIFNYFKGIYIKVFQIDADNILSQTNARCILKFRRVLRPVENVSIKKTSTPEQIEALRLIREKFKSNG